MRTWSILIAEGDGILDELRDTGHKAQTTEQYRAGLAGGGQKTPPPPSLGQCISANRQVLKRNLAPFESIDGRRDYRAMFRAVYEFHAHHNPPRAEGDFWVEVADEANRIAALFDNGSFVLALLGAVYDELERESRR